MARRLRAPVWIPARAWLRDRRYRADYQANMRVQNAFMKSCDIVLTAMQDGDPGRQWLVWCDLDRATGLSYGKLYPALMYLYANGIIGQAFTPASLPGSPTRKTYFLTNHPGGSQNATPAAP